MRHTRVVRSHQRRSLRGTTGAAGVIGASRSRHSGVAASGGKVRERGGSRSWRLHMTPDTGEVTRYIMPYPRVKTLTNCRKNGGDLGRVMFPVELGNSYG